MAFFFIHQNSSIPIQVADKEILDRDKTPFEWHSKFSKTHYDFKNITPKQQKLALSNTELLLPDLRASGCRLTLHLGSIMPFNDDMKKLSLETNFKNWMVNDTQIWVLASGMDQKRFASITNYLQEYTRASETTYLSNLVDTMDDVYKSARSCG